MAGVDCRRRKPAIGERPHERKKSFLPGSGSVEKDHGRPAIVRGRGLEEHAGHPFSGLGREAELLGAIGSSVDPRLRLRCERHTRPRDHLEEGSANPHGIRRLRCDVRKHDGDEPHDEQHAVITIRSSFFAFR